MSAASRPPRIATWLLKHFGRPASTEAITGDLVEQFKHGRSRTWYWRQVFVALCAGVVEEVRSHPGRAALSAGFAWLLLLFQVVWIQRLFSAILESRSMAWFSIHQNALGGMLLLCGVIAGMVCAGLIVRLTHSRTMVVPFLGSIVLVHLLLSVLPGPVGLSLLRAYQALLIPPNVWVGAIVWRFTAGDAMVILGLLLGSVIVPTGIRRPLTREAGTQ